MHFWRPFSAFLFYRKHIPEGWELPISLRYIYSVETDKQKADYSGSLYFDDLKFIYTDETADLSGPEFSDTLPGSESVYTDSIAFSTVITDDLSGVDADSIVVKRNDVVIADYIYDEASGRLSFTLQDLSDGDYTIYVEAYDEAGNQSVPWIEKTYHVDTSPDTDAPVLTDVTPTSAVTVKIPTPRITFKLKDEKSTVDSADISIKLDDVALSVYYDSSTGWGYAEPEGELTRGSHTLSIEASDPAGNPVQYSDTIDVEPIAQPDDGENFTISIIPDTQGNAYTQGIFTRAEADDTSLILHMGDIVDNGTKADYDAAEEYAEIFTDKPLFVAAGNHEAFLNTLNLFYETFGSPTYHFDYGDTMIVVLNSAYGQSITASDSTQFHYLNEILSENTKHNVIVVNHVITHDSFDTAHAMTSAEAEQFESILTSYKTNHPDVTIDVLFGHLHTLQSWEIGGVNYIITGNAADKNYVTYDEGSFLGSGKFTIENGRMSYSYDPYVTSVTIENDSISNDSLAMTANTQQQLTLTGNFHESPSNYSVQISDFDLVDITWSSSNPEVAEVDENGCVRALKAGASTITATSGGKSASIDVTVTEGTLDELNMFYGFDIKSGELKNEDGGTVTNSTYTESVTGSYTFETDDDLDQTVLCGPASGTLTIGGIDLSALDNQMTVEAYVKIPSELSTNSTPYDVFQFGDQNINLVGVPGQTYFGAGRYSGGDADISVNKELPTGEWVHVICTEKEGEQVLYVNGEEFLRGRYTGLTITSGGENTIVLGGYYGRSGEVEYANLRIYTNYVDSALAQQMYNCMEAGVAQNAAPEAKNPVPGQNVTVGGSIEITASDIAVDENGDDLTITAIVSGPDSSVASVSLSDIGLATIVGTAEGSTTMTVTVSDATETVNVTVPIIVAAASDTAAPAVTASYSGGVVTVEGTGLEADTEYTVRIVNTAQTSVAAMGQTTSNDSGKISASITTGVLTTLSNYTVYVNNQDGTLAAQDDTITSGSSGGTITPAAPSVETSTRGNTTTTSGVLKGTADSTGKVSGRVGATLASALIDGAKETETEGRRAVVEFRLETNASATAAEVTIPKAFLDSLANDTEAELKINTGIGSVSFDSAAVHGIDSGLTGTITISIAKANTANLSDEERAQIGSRPVYDFTVTSGSRTISGFGGGTATISIPYTPASNEDTNAIIAYSISDSGALETMRGAYNADTGCVEVTTSHFSKYAVGYNKVAFSDVAQTAWYQEAVTFVAARGIAAGTGNGSFSPENTLTRGQFIVMLMRAYGIEADSNSTDNFIDAGNTYYTDYLAAAKRLGISSGIGNNEFAPDREITRQDMLTQLYRVLDVLGELPEVTTDKTVNDFGDAGEIADYAMEAMNALVKGGIVAGSEGMLNPADTTTRAQMAQVLFKLLS